jgi:hypothetical protein
MVDGDIDVPEIEVTDGAVEVLLRSMELAGVDPVSGGVRLRAARALGGGIDVQVELADGPIGEEVTAEVNGIRLFVDPEVVHAVPDPVVTVEPQHEVVVVRTRDKME